MNPECSKPWTRKQIRDAFTLVFINGTLREHKERVLFDKERALLPATQSIVEGKIEAKKIQKEIHAVYEQMAGLRRQVEQLELARRQAETHRPRAEARAFVRACPAEECRGFLSTQWKCGVCEKWTCPECHIVKGYTRDAEHTCNEDDVATARLLAADTKPCPKCATGIFKIDGCFAKDSPILLWDGSIKMSQDICIGDVLVGDDGLQRIVLDTTNGIDDLYEVVQTNGVPYTVNSKHTLVLKYSGDKTISWYETNQRWKIKWFDRTLKKQRTKDFTISDFVSKDEAFIAATKFKDTLIFDEIIDYSNGDIFFGFVRKR